jgi:8-oxo-dGTP diphosphatase
LSDFSAIDVKQPDVTRLPRVEVAVGAIVDNSTRTVLMALRADDAHQGGLWEFPGGKVEPSESVEQALARELDEELGIAVEASEPLLRIEHDYADRLVALDVWLVSAFSGAPKGRQGQPLRWVGIDELHTLDLPRANQAIVAALQVRFATVDLQD